MANLINANHLRKGIVFVQGGEVWKVIDYKHIKMGRGQATVRLKISNIQNGIITEKTYDPGDRLEEADVTKRNAQFLYQDGTKAYFMDNDDYSQFDLPVADLSYELDYLIEGQKIVVMVLDNKAISIELPMSVILEVIDAPEATAGDSAVNASKKVKMQTGLEINVPLFIKRGDLLKINTDTKEYVSRA